MWVGVGDDDAGKRVQAAVCLLAVSLVCQWEGEEVGENPCMEIDQASVCALSRSG